MDEKVINQSSHIHEHGHQHAHEDDSHMHQHEHCHEHEHEHCHCHDHAHGEDSCGCGHHHVHSSDFSKVSIFLCVAGLVLFGLSYLPLFNNWISLAIIVIAYFLISHKIIINFINSLKSFNIFDENFLMLVASFGALCIGEHAEAIAVMVFYQIGEFFQEMAVNKSRKSISDLMNIKPDKARILKDGTEKEVPPEQVQIGDIIKVIPGEKIPLDGIVTHGNGLIDTSALTGESVPLEADIHTSVLSGSINKTGVLEIRVTKPFGESTVSKILELVENASSKKSKSEHFITKFAKVYTPIVVFAAVALAVIGGGITGQFSDWVSRALTFLVVSCPCALVLSVPLSYFAAIGNAAKYGILIKGGNYLEMLNQIDTVVFDKTGTLTTGTFKVDQITPMSALSSDEILKLAAIAESASTHPIAVSICKAYGQKPDTSLLTDCHEQSALGITGRYNGKDIAVGSAKLMQKLHIEIPESQNTVVYVAIDHQLVGKIELRDEIRTDAVELMRSLKRDTNIQKTVMLTGDNTQAANTVAQNLHVDAVHAKLLPADKVNLVEQYKKDKKVAFVGDGINDAPVIAMADVGFAMGGIGSDSAIEAADIVLMNDKPSLVQSALRLAKKTKVIVTQNIVFSLAVKIIIMLISALGYPMMWAAVFADVGVALIAVLNSMRLLKYHL